MENKFTTQGMNFEICRLSGESVIKIMSVKPRVLLFDLPAGIGVEAAAWVVEGYLRGHEDGIRAVTSRVNLHDFDIKNRYTLEHYEAKELRGGGV